MSFLNFIPGQNCKIQSKDIKIKIKSNKKVYSSAFLLQDNNKAINDIDMIFAGNKSNNNNSLKLLEQNETISLFELNFDNLPTYIKKISFACSLDSNKFINDLSKLNLTIEENNIDTISCDVDVKERKENALIIGEFYKRNEEWKFRFISQGFDGGIKPLAENYGINLDLSKYEESKSIVDTTTVNLNKISLTKTNSTVSLSKKGDYGIIKVNLNWNQGKKGLFNFFSKSSNIDLDLGCFVRLQNSDQEVIQALGNNFGSLDYEPYVKLLGDDRTGSSDNFSVLKKYAFIFYHKYKKNIVYKYVNF